jgi:transposase
MPDVIEIELEGIQALDESLRQKILEALQQSSRHVASLEEKLRVAELENGYLRELLRRQRIAKYGPSSEKLSDAQLALLELEPGVHPAEVDAESLRQPLDLTPRKPRKAAAHPGRQALPAHLPRVERIVRCTPEQCICGQCGKPTCFIGYEQSEQLDFEPAKPFVFVTKREKRACKDCEEQGVQTALLPARIIPKGLVSDRLIIDTVINKYCNFLPLYRQSVILQRETGLELSRATLCGWVMTVGELLLPICGAMRLELLRSDYLQADSDAGGRAIRTDQRQESSGLPVAIWAARQHGGVRLPDGPQRQRARTVPGRLCGAAADRWLRRLWPGGRPRAGARRLLSPMCAATSMRRCSSTVRTWRPSALS